MSQLKYPVDNWNRNWRWHIKDFNKLMQRLSRQEVANGRPMLTATVIRKDTGLPGEGFFKLARELGLMDGLEPSEFHARELNRVWEEFTQQLGGEVIIVVFMLNGKPIDVGIASKELVADIDPGIRIFIPRIRASGFNTCDCCSGMSKDHSDGSKYFPSVWVTLPEGIIKKDITKDKSTDERNIPLKRRDFLKPKVYDILKKSLKKIGWTVYFVRINRSVSGRPITLDRVEFEYEKESSDAAINKAFSELTSLLENTTINLD
jgi:hypothetical protein